MLPKPNPKALLVLALAVLALNAFELTSEEPSKSINKPVAINWGNLKEFKNITGATFGQKQLDSLINFANSASSFYGGSSQKNVQYIQTNMNSNFGDANHMYSVVLQVSPVTRDLGGAFFYCQDGSNFAQLGYGTNRIYSNFTYLVYRLVTSPSYTWTFKDKDQGRGAGLTAAQGDQINYVIKGVDGTTACDCSRTSDISTNFYLGNVIDCYWNVVCQSTLGTVGSVAISNNQWLLSKPGTCNYFIYAISKQ